ALHVSCEVDTGADRPTRLVTRFVPVREYEYLLSTHSEMLFFSSQCSSTINSQSSAQRVFLSPARKHFQWSSSLSPLMNDRCAIFFIRRSATARNSLRSQLFQGKRKPCFRRWTISSGSSGFSDSTSRLFG